MNTKQKILSKALVLFNQYGHRDVTTRMIADALSISLGNLTYHFKKKEEIIIALYYELVAEMNILFDMQSQMKEINVQHFYDGTKACYTIFVKYKFCMIDFVQLLRTHSKIKIHYQQLMEVRKQQMGEMFFLAITQGVIKPEEFENQYMQLGLSMGVYGDYWLSHAEVLFENNSEHTINQYVNGALLMLYPYFTDSAKEEYKKIMNLS